MTGPPSHRRLGGYRSARYPWGATPSGAIPGVCRPRSKGFDVARSRRGPARRLGVCWEERHVRDYCFRRPQRAAVHGSARWPTWRPRCFAFGSRWLVDEWRARARTGHETPDALRGPRGGKPSSSGPPRRGMNTRSLHPGGLRHAPDQDCRPAPAVPPRPAGGRTASGGRAGHRRCGAGGGPRRLCALRTPPSHPEPALRDDRRPAAPGVRRLPGQLVDRPVRVPRPAGRAPREPRWVCLSTTPPCHGEQVDRLLPRCDGVLTNEGHSLETFYARYVAEVRPRLATYFVVRNSATG